MKSNENKLGKKGVSNEADSHVREKWIGRLVEIVDVKYYSGQLATIDDIEHTPIGYQIHVTTLKDKELSLMLGEVRVV